MIAGLAHRVIKSKYIRKIIVFLVNWPNWSADYWSTIIKASGYLPAKASVILFKICQLSIISHLPCISMVFCDRLSIIWSINLLNLFDENRWVNRRAAQLTIDQCQWVWLWSPGRFSSKIHQLSIMSQLPRISIVFCYCLSIIWCIDLLNFLGNLMKTDQIIADFSFALARHEVWEAGSLPTISEEFYFTGKMVSDIVFKIHQLSIISH